MQLKDFFQFYQKSAEFVAKAWRVNIY